MVSLQSSVDVFFLDWERPHATLPRSQVPLPKIHRDAPSRVSIAEEGGASPSQSAGTGETGSVANGNSKAQPGSTVSTVSIWRTYFVANEWCELQCHRRVALPTQLLVLLFMLKVRAGAISGAKHLYEPMSALQLRRSLPTGGPVAVNFYSLTAHRYTI